MWVELHNGKVFSCEMIDPMPVSHSSYVKYYLEREVFE
jgi:hypothetical protein